METYRLIQDGDDYFLPTYARQKRVLMRGEGIHVFDSERVVYLDFLSGISVNALGHGAPEIVKAVTEQIQKLAHVSNLYYNEPSIRLAKFLCEISGMNKVFFCNSGAEAVEAALKLARKYHRRRGQDRFEFLAFHRSFHGRTFGALSVTGQAHHQEGFEPLLMGVTFVPYNDLDSAKRVIHEKTAAVIVEAVQGEGGVHPADPGFFRGLREITREAGVPLIVDEVQCGFGRTGKMWGFQHYDVEPDMIVCAKALGGGLPMGALLVAPPFTQGFQPGDHASTFGGNPVCSAAALAFLETLIMKDLPAHAAKHGETLKNKLEQLVARYPDFLKSVRGRGLLLGVEMQQPLAKAWVEACARNGLLVGAAGENVLRLSPPLILTETHIEEALQKMEQALHHVQKNPESLV